MSRRLMIGLSAGSNAMGVDATLVQAEGAGFGLSLRPLHALRFPLPRDLRDLIVRLLDEPSATLRHLGWIHRALGETFVAAAQRLAQEARQPLNQAFAIGLSEWTAWHDLEARYPTLLSFGMAECVAEATGLTAIADFPTRDVVCGGMGFGLTPLVDRLLFSDPAEERVLLHIGHAASLVWLPRLGDRRPPIAFQAAPAGMLLDGLMRKMTQGREPCDPGGKNAVQGRCIDDLLERWLALPILQRRPPKAIARDDFGDGFIAQAVALARARGRNLHDILCTATHFVARSVVDAIQRHLPESPGSVLVSGGGVRNGFLWNLIEQGLAPIPMDKIDRHGVPADARKSIAVAGLAAMAIDGATQPIGPSGARRARLVGRFVPGSEENWRRCLEWMAALQSTPRLAAA